MSERASGAGSLLIVTGDRGDRRALFDALDGENFDALYTARDLAQARSLIEQDPHLDLVLLEFAQHAEQSAALCTWLKDDPAFASLPIIGILRNDPGPQQWSYLRPPPGVVGWIRSPVHGGEALLRVRAVLAGRDEQGTLPLAAGDAQPYRFAFDASLDELVISDPHSGLIIEVNATFEQRSGLRAQQVVGRPVSSLDASGSRERRKAFADQLLDRGSAQVRFVRERADGSRCPLEVFAQLTMRGAAMVQFNVIREIGPLVDAQRSLATLVALHAAPGGEEGLKQAVDVLGERMELDYLALAGAGRDGQGPRVLARYQRRASLSGMSEAIGQPVLSLVLNGETLVHLDDARRLAEVDEFVRAAAFVGFVGLPLLDSRKNVLGAMLVGSRKSLAGREGLLDTLRIAAARFASALQLRVAREQGRAQGLHDALTGLPNRLLFNDRLESTLREVNRTGEMFAVLFLDLDRFKTINDSLGHNTGDQVLSAVARRLSGSVRGSDTVARYAGDEFTMVLRHIVQREDVLRIAAKIIHVLEAPLTLEDGSELRITASLGISFYPDDADNAEDLLKHADVAMYSAKGMGRNNFQTYVAVPEESHQQRMALESKLRLAQRNNELRVHYQPQVNAETEDIVGMEALVRWEHPELGMISPGFFIPLAEETGLIVSLGEWVLRTACRDAHRWHQKFHLPLRISVNLSALQLRQPNLVALVSSVVKQTGIDPRLLDMEVTESINVRDIPNLLQTLGGIRALGCGVSIDDFGTGQSSLDYIRHVPADRIKIDQSFVRNIGVDPDDEAIVRATITMAHSLNHSVVAEGVEVEEHLEFLRAHGCEELQGYLFSRPLAAAAFENLLVERARIRAGGTPVGVA